MRVVAITNLFPNPAEPTRATFNAAQISALARLCDVSVIAPISWLTKLRLRSRRTLAGVSNCRDWRGVPVCYPTYFYTPKVLRSCYGIFMTLSLFPSCWRALRAGPCLVYATWAFPDGFAAVILGALFRRPVVVKVHGTDVENLATDRLRRKLTVWALNKARTVISVSEYLQHKLVDFGVEPAKLRVLYNGVDVHRFKVVNRLVARRSLEEVHAGRLGLYVGNLKPEKGVEELVEALSADQLERLDLKLVIAGAGASRQRLEQLITARNLQARIELIGIVDHEDVAKWMNAADFLCLPSHHEGMPNVVIEALMCGTPVIATRVGGIPEIVNVDNGLLVEPRDIAGLSVAIDQMATQQWNREHVAGSVKFGDWNLNATQLVALLSSAEKYSSAAGLRGSANEM